MDDEQPKPEPKKEENTPDVTTGQKVVTTSDGPPVDFPFMGWNSIYPTRQRGENTPKVATRPHPKKKRCRQCGRKMSCVLSPRTCGGPYDTTEEE